MPVKKTKLLSHKQLVGKMLKNPAVKSEFDKLNREEFASEMEAKVLSAEWRRNYNEQRPHSALGDKTPAEFAARWRAVE